VLSGAARLDVSRPPGGEPTVASELAALALRLEAAGIESARLDAELLCAHVLETTRAGLYGDSGGLLTAGEAEALSSLAARRALREPLAYVLGEWGFRRLTLTTDARALVPRPETEIVVERCLRLLGSSTAPRVLDVGTGSGAIALAIADEHPGAVVTGLDASPDALELAGENASRTGIGIELVQGDLLEGLPAGPWDLIASNPPYVAPEEVATLPPEVRGWEPRSALVALGHTEALVGAARGVLRLGGALVLETHELGAGGVAALLASEGFDCVAVTPDLTGRDRVVEGLTPSGL
jgi:release factor glutamine methyltransferase